MVCVECYFSVDSKFCFPLDIYRLLLVAPCSWYLFTSYDYNRILSLQKNK